MPASAIAAITVSWMTGSVHSVMPSSTGRSRFSAYQQAAQLAGTDQDATDVKAFLKERKGLGTPATRAAILEKLRK